jgi:UDP-N-acetylglucosamine 1-carboxyvinyltransferase
VIRNAAAEPHVVALCEFLKEAGAHIEGQGSSTLTVCGGKPLHGCATTIIPDMIEAGTYLCAAMAAGGRVTVKNVVPQHLEAALDVLRAMGANLTVGKSYVTLRAPSRYLGVEVTTGPYPAFPTDLHPQLAALFALGHRATGTGRVVEAVWQERFRYAEELGKLGARVRIQGASATFSPSVLHAATLRSPDLRGGAALLIAALATEGRTEITNAATVGRGYEHLESKFRALGADIRVFG